MRFLLVGLLFTLVPQVGRALDSAEGSIPILEVQIQHQARTSLADIIEPAVLYRRPWGGLFRVELGGKMGLGPWRIDRLGYKGQVDFAPVEWFQLGLRLFHGDYFQHQFATSQLVALGRLQFYPVSFFGLRFGGGWYESFTRLASNRALVPAFAGGVRDHDFLVELGMMIKPSEIWELSGRLSTFDEFYAFNFNNPFVEVALDYGSLGKWKLRAFARYRILLGFGRLDELTSALVLHRSF